MGPWKSRRLPDRDRPPGRYQAHPMPSTAFLAPVSREMVASNKKAAFTTVALFRHAFPAAKLFTGKFFFLGGSTDLRPQADGSLAGDLSGISAKELLGVLRPYTFPPADLHQLT